MITRIHYCLTSGNSAGLEVEIIMIVLQDDWELYSIPDVPQPHLPSCKMRVKHSADNPDPWFRNSLFCAFRCAVAYTGKKVLSRWNKLEKVDFTSDQQHSSVIGPQLISVLDPQPRIITNSTIPNSLDFSAVTFLALGHLRLRFFQRHFPCFVRFGKQVPK